MVAPIPSAPASAFISATKPASLPPTPTASMRAMLLPEGISNASSSWRSVSRSPARTATTDWPSSASSATARAWAAVTVIVKPSSPAPSGKRSSVR